MESGFFTLPNITSNEIRLMYDLHSDLGNFSSSPSLSSSRSSSTSSTASYERTDTSLGTASLNLNDEYSFTCVHPSSPNYPYYVSAEYHVGEFDQPYMPGRFMFGNVLPGRRHVDQEMILAETPATVHDEAGFNVEIDYLDAREGKHPGKGYKEGGLHEGCSRKTC